MTKFFKIFNQTFTEKRTYMWGPHVSDTIFFYYILCTGKGTVAKMDLFKSQTNSFIVIISDKTYSLHSNLVCSFVHCLVGNVYVELIIELHKFSNTS